MPATYPTIPTFTKRPQPGICVGRSDLAIQHTPTTYGLESYAALIAETAVTSPTKFAMLR